MKGIIHFIALLLFISLSPLDPAKAQETSALKGLDVNQPIDIEADRLEANDKDGTAQLIGRVRVVQGALTLETNSLMIYFDRVPGQEDPEIIRIDALEPLTVISATETVNGSWGVYDVAKRIITIGGDVDLKRKDATLKGSLLQINLVDGITTLDSAAVQEGTTSRVKGRFLAPPVKK